MARKSAIGAADTAEMVQWLFENSRDPMHVVSEDGRFLLVNPAWTEITGLTADELIGSPCLDQFNPEDVVNMKARAHAARLGDLYENEVRVRTRTGDWVWYASRRQLMPNGSHIVTMYDATAQRTARAEIEDARRTRKELSTAAGIGIWEYDPAADAIWWSEELMELAGFDPDVAWTTERFYALVHPKDHQPLSRALTGALVTGEPVTVEHRIWAHGRWLTMRATVRPEASPRGLYRLKGISEDITALAEARDAARRGEQQMRRARREVQATASRLNLALQAAEAGAYEIDHVKKTFWCSPEFERITGQSGSSYDEACELRYPGFHTDDLPHVRASFRSLHRGETGAAESFEARIVRPDGSERWVRVHHHLQVSRNGRWRKAVGLIQDCDAAKRQELALIEAQKAAEEAAEAKATFLANMSHEIRTPLNGVMGVLHLLKSETLSGEGRDLLDEALTCGRMLSELLTDVIDFSKIEAGKLELNREALDPAALVQGVVQLLEPQARSKGLQLVIDADPGLGWVMSDPVRLRQALFNLLGNAVKFTETGRIVVRCRSADAGVLRFEVEDTGIGIAAEAQSRIFGRFSQADASTTRKFGGSGLGLAITSKLAELMDGHTGFVSKEGQGSTFWFEVRAEAAESCAGAAEITPSLLEGVRVLVVEDNPTNRLIATKLLEQMGASVETANDGYLGVEAAEREVYDLILMDIQMPGIDGLEAARRIRALGGAAAFTPIVALTANVLAHQRQAYLDAGMDAVVGKPISPSDLLREITAAADASAAREATAIRAVA